MKKLMLILLAAISAGSVYAAVQGKTHHWCRHTCNTGPNSGYDFSAKYKADSPGSHDYHMKNSSCNCNNNGITNISTVWNHK